MHILSTMVASELILYVFISTYFYNINIIRRSISLVFNAGYSSNTELINPQRKGTQLQRTL